MFYHEQNLKRHHENPLDHIELMDLYRLMLLDWTLDYEDEQQRRTKEEKRNDQIEERIDRFTSLCFSIIV